MNYQDWYTDRCTVRRVAPEKDGALTVHKRVAVAEDAAPNTLNYGSFISAVINFLILSLVVFCIVKAVNRAMDSARKKEKEAPPPPPEPSAEEKLLAEIRDLLKNNRSV